jgi:hypothetical protein
MRHGSACAVLELHLLGKHEIADRIGERLGLTASQVEVFIFMLAAGALLIKWQISDWRDYRRRLPEWNAALAEQNARDARRS